MLLENDSVRARVTDTLSWQLTQCAQFLLQLTKILEKSRDKASGSVFITAKRRTCCVAMCRLERRA